MLLIGCSVLVDDVYEIRSEINIKITKTHTHTPMILEIHQTHPPWRVSLGDLSCGGCNYIKYHCASNKSINRKIYEANLLLHHRHLPPH